MWYKGINVEDFSGCSNPSFIMSVYSGTIYISLYYEGHILAADLSGRLIWRNMTAVPNGIFANRDGIFVCNPSHNNIVVPHHNGQLNCALLLEGVKRPWSIAIAKFRLGVVERPCHLRSNRNCCVKYYSYNTGIYCK